MFIVVNVCNDYNECLQRLQSDATLVPKTPSDVGPPNSPNNFLVLLTQRNPFPILVKITRIRLYLLFPDLSWPIGIPFGPKSIRKWITRPIWPFFAPHPLKPLPPLLTDIRGGGNHHPQVRGYCINCYEINARVVWFHPKYLKVYSTWV